MRHEMCVSLGYVWVGYDRIGYGIKGYVYISFIFSIQVVLQNFLNYETVFRCRNQLNVGNILSVLQTKAIFGSCDAMVLDIVG